MGVEPIASRLQGERTAIVLSRQMKGRVLIGSTRNPTSTSETHVPFATDIRPVRYTPCRGVQFYWFTPSASRGRACHIRDCDLSSFPMSSYSFYTS